MLPLYKKIKGAETNVSTVTVSSYKVLGTPSGQTSQKIVVSEVTAQSVHWTLLTCTVGSVSLLPKLFPVI